MSAAEIIAELPRLSSAELAQIEAKLRELTDSARATELPAIDPTRAPRIHSPRLAHPEQSADFEMEIVEP